MGFDDVGELIEEAAAVAGVHFGPVAFFEGFAGGFDGAVDVLVVAAGDVGDFFFGGGWKVSKVLPDSESTHWPPMSILVALTLGRATSLAEGFLGVAVDMGRAPWSR